MLASTVGHASFHTAGASGPSISERSNARLPDGGDEGGDGAMDAASVRAAVDTIGLDVVDAGHGLSPELPGDDSRVLNDTAPRPAAFGRTSGVERFRQV